MSDPLSFGCACGAVRGELSGSCAAAATRIVCHCNDCRAFLVACGRDDPGAAEGVGIIQLAPAGMRFTAGAEHLAALHLSPRGLHRWQAGCCATPMAATMPSRAVPFAGLLVACLDTPERLGKVRTHGFVRRADGQMGHKNVGRLVRGILSRTIAAYAKGEARVTPFRKPDGALIAEPLLLDKARRDAIYAQL